VFVWSFLCIGTRKGREVVRIFFFSFTTTSPTKKISERESHLEEDGRRLGDIWASCRVV